MLTNKKENKRNNQVTSDASLIGHQGRIYRLSCYIRLDLDLKGFILCESHSHIK